MKITLRQQSRILFISLSLFLPFLNAQRFFSCSLSIRVYLRSLRFGRQHSTDAERLSIAFVRGNRTRREPTSKISLSSKEVQNFSSVDVYVIHWNLCLITREKAVMIKMIFIHLLRKSELLPNIPKLLQSSGRINFM